MSGQVVYCQINKDYAYWTEKRRVGQQKGGHVAGLLTHREDREVRLNILMDTGLGTLEGLADFCEDCFWDEPLVVFITHGHIDHHAELMILSEIYCKRRGKHLHDVRPPLSVFGTAETHEHLVRVHQYGFAGGGTLQQKTIVAGSPVIAGIFQVTPLAVDHFEGAVIYVVEFGAGPRHKIIIGWDLKTPPLDDSQVERLRRPSLALIESTTWTPMTQDTGHASIEQLVSAGFLDRLELRFDPGQEVYGAYLVHYSGWEDPWGMLADAQLKAQFDRAFPRLSEVVRVAERGQRWSFAV